MTSELKIAILAEVNHNPMKNNFFYFVLATFLLVGCTESDRNNEDVTVSSYEYVRAQNAFLDVWKEVHATIVSDPVLGGQTTVPSLDACVDTMTRVPANGPYPITLTIDYGPGEICTDGRLRKGKIIAVLSRPYSDSLAEVRISFEDYFMDDLAFFGDMRIVNLGDSALLPRFYQEVDSARLYRDDLGNKRQDIWVEYIRNRGYQGTGNDTYGDPSDDEFRLTNGTAKGRNTFGKFFEAATTQTIITRVDCAYESGGMITVKQTNLADRFLDYEGGCNGDFAVTYYNTTEYLSIP
jgi:hypothetical protein